MRINHVASWYQDLSLIDLTENVVYSVDKEADFATSVLGASCR